MRILLHTCCAPCLIYPLKFLKSRSFEVTPYFFNPNIHPYSEYKKRLTSFKEYSSKNSLNSLYEPDLDLSYYFHQIVHNENNRCNICYTLRLKKTVEMATEKGFDCFSSTLLYSKYQKHAAIIEICKNLEKEYNISFFYSDFRKGWQEGIDKSIKENIYRQKYCGCIYSEQERFDNRLKKRLRKLQKQL